jgi:hypothetical protein
MSNTTSKKNYLVITEKIEMMLHQDREQNHDICDARLQSHSTEIYFPIECFKSLLDT